MLRCCCVSCCAAFESRRADQLPVDLACYFVCGFVRLFFLCVPQVGCDL